MSALALLLLLLGALGSPAKSAPTTLPVFAQQYPVSLQSSEGSLIGKRRLEAVLTQDRALWRSVFRSRQVRGPGSAFRSYIFGRLLLSRRGAVEEAG